MSNGDRNDFTRGCAFWGILITAALFVASSVIRWVTNDLDGLIFILELLAKLALLVAVAFPAWDFVCTRRKPKGWKVVYWIMLVIYVFGVVFGVLKFYIHIG